MNPFHQYANLEALCPSLDIVHIKKTVNNQFISQSHYMFLGLILMLYTTSIFSEQPQRMARCSTAELFGTIVEDSLYATVLNILV